MNRCEYVVSSGLPFASRLVMDSGGNLPPKRFKTESSSLESFPNILPGSQVRLVNLPAHPGLEGVVATVINIDEENFVEVEIRKTKLIKKVCLFFCNFERIFFLRSSETRSDRSWSDV